MEIQLIDHKGFISTLSQDAPSIILFRPQIEDKKKKVKTIKDTLNQLEKMPKAYFYEFITDGSPENQNLCDLLEVSPGVSLVLYKNGCFNQYKSNPTTKDIKQIWGAARIRNTQEKTFTPRVKEKSSDYISMDID